MRKTKEFHEMIAQFEKDMNKQCGARLRFDREKGANVPAVMFYEDGVTNDIFRAYMAGCAYGKFQALGA